MGSPINGSIDNLISDSCLNDPIIKQMLTGRDIDSSDQAEMERLNRMIMMLKSSKKYRRLSVESANNKWANERPVVDHENSVFLSGNSEYISGDSKLSSKSQRTVRFSDSVKVIEYAEDSNFTLLEKLAKAARRMSNVF
jgi:hypothetical protein